MEFSEKKEKIFDSYRISDDSLEMFIIQFTALSYIEKGAKRRPVNDKANYFKLTSLGEKAMYELRAIRKDDSVKIDEPDEDKIVDEDD